MNRINQPDIISVDSFMDTTTQTNGQYYTFVNHAPNTALVGAKKVHLLKCSIPYIASTLPNYSLVFYYHRLASATAIPDATTLKAVRLYPSTYTPPSGFINFTINQFYQTPQELVDNLNTAAAAGGDNVAYNTKWVADDITFAYSNNLNQIYFYGNNNFYYCSAGYNDPFVKASQASNDILTYNVDGTTSRQPYASGFTLNLRCGFACDGINIPLGSYGNLVSPLCANLTGRSFPQDGNVFADTYPDLNYTSNIYLYSNIVANSGFGSVNKKNLLAVIPVDVPLGGVVQYIGHSTPAYATKVASEIYSVDIEMRDDANMPFYLPDSANVNIVLNILYE